MSFSDFERDGTERQGEGETRGQGEGERRKCILLVPLSPPLPLCLLSGDEFQTNGRRDFGRLPRRRQLPGLLVDAEGDHVVGVLIGREQKRARRIDGEITWPFAPGRFVTDEV